MSYFDDASLVMIPSGYKEDKVYSVKPIDGSGDLTFTRSNDTATRVGPDGLIEKVRTNLLLQSNTFDTTWLFSGTGTVTQGAADPFGGTTAWTLAKTTSNTFLYQSTAGFSGGITFSIYAKAGTVDQLFLNHDQGSTFQSYFDLTLGTAIAPSGCVATIVAVGNGWYRCSIAGTIATPNNIRLYPASGGSISGTTGSILIYAAQAETGDIATEYIPTTTAAVSVGPVANVPRLDYSGGATCPSLLLEPQRTNLITYSEDLSNAVWSKYLTTITTNNIISPSGYQDADLATSTAGGDLKNILTLSTSTTYTASFYVKKGTAADAKYRVYNFDTATNVVAPTSYITQTNNSTWVRVSFSFTSSASGTSYGIYLLEGASAGTMYFWGAQLEQGYPTSYINTLSAAVTRGADACSKTGISSLIGQTEGTLFAEFEATAEYDANNLILTLSDGTANNVIYINRSNGITEFFVMNGGSAQVNSTSIAITEGRHKIAFAYKANDFKVYMDGTDIFTDGSGSVPACSKLNVGSYYDGNYPYNNGIKQTLLFPTRLTNAQLAELTTL